MLGPRLLSLSGRKLEVRQTFSHCGVEEEKLIVDRQLITRDFRPVTDMVILRSAPDCQLWHVAGHGLTDTKRKRGIAQYPY